jgi:hypothetical protein
MFGIAKKKQANYKIKSKKYYFKYILNVIFLTYNLQLIFELKIKF